jgi:hypothetical protein
MNSSLETDCTGIGAGNRLVSAGDSVSSSSGLNMLISVPPVRKAIVFPLAE